MPVTGSRTRKDDNNADYASMMGLGHINTTSFLFGEDDEKAAAHKDATTSPDVNSYLQMNATNDKFPILVRRDEYPGLVSCTLGKCQRTLMGHRSFRPPQLHWTWPSPSLRVPKHR